MNHRNFWQKIFLNSNTKTNGTTCREEIKNGEQSLLERNGNGKSVKKVNCTAESQKMLGKIIRSNIILYESTIFELILFFTTPKYYIISFSAPYLHLSIRLRLFRKIGSEFLQNWSFSWGLKMFVDIRFILMFCVKYSIDFVCHGGGNLNV